MQETRIPSLSWEDPLEEEMATHSSILAWKISCTEEPDGLQSMGFQRVRHDLATEHTHTDTHTHRHTHTHTHTNVILLGRVFLLVKGRIGFITSYIAPLPDKA